jgi:hypothetical protein
VPNPPDYWRVLTTKVPEDKGIPSFSDVHIWNIEATGAKTAIAIAAYPSKKLKNFHIDHVNIAAESAGSISNTDNLVIEDVKLKVPSDSRLKSDDNVGLLGLDSVHYE